MATNGLEIAADHIPAPAPPDVALLRSRTLEGRSLDADHARTEIAAEAAKTAQDFVLAPLVDKIAYGISRGLATAIKELEHHIAGEAKKVGDAVDRRLDALQASMQEVARFVTDQHSTNSAFQGQLQELSLYLRETAAQQAAAVAAQREADALRKAEMAALSQLLSDRIEALCRESGVHQEDLSAIKSTIGVIVTRVDTLAERLDRQAEAVRSMYSAYSQREAELEQVVDGLARLRAFPAFSPSNGL